MKEFQRNESTKPHQLPIYATSSFDFDKIDDGIDIFTGKATGHVYSRYGNPTVDTVANKLAWLESYDTDLNAYGFLIVKTETLLLYIFCSFRNRPFEFEQ